MKKKKKKELIQGEELVICRNKQKKNWRLRRMTKYLCWAVFLFSFCFAIYKNFTAIDKETIHEKKVVEEKVYDLSGLTTFTENFAKVYFSQYADNAKQMERMEQLARYMQADLVDMNQGVSGQASLEQDVTVSGVQVWDVKALNGEKTDFTVTFGVVQTTPEKTESGCYKMEVHKERDAYIVTKNPSVTSGPVKASYEKGYLKMSDDLDIKEQKEIEEFVNTFFSIYPKCTEKELVYYVTDETARPIEKEYELQEVKNLAIEKTKDGYKVACFVVYNNKAIGINNINQYELSLSYQEDGKLIITEMG